MNQQARIRKSRRTHARTRAKGRYGLDLTCADLDNIVKLIQKHNGAFIARRSNDRTIWRVVYKETEMFAVYSKKHRLILTFLPPDARELNSPEL